MPPFAAHLLLVPMLATVSAVVALAQAPVPSNSDSEYGTHLLGQNFNCGDLSGKRSPAAEHLMPEPADQSTATTFIGTRPLVSRSNTPLIAELSLCQGEMLLRRAHSPAVTLTVALRKPLPAGRTVADYIHTLASADGTVKLMVDLPTDTAPHITLDLPEPTTSKIALSHGHLVLNQLLGDTEIAIAKGEVDLHASNDNFSSVQSAAAVGGICDKRPHGFGNHGHMLSSFNGRGIGKYTVRFAAAAGHLNLLPPL